MIRLVRLVVNFFREKRANSGDRQQRLWRGNSKLKRVQGTVTAFQADHGWIDESIYFSIDDVTGKVPLKVGKKVIAVIEEDRRSHRSKAFKVYTISDDCRVPGPLKPRLSHLVTCITTVTKDAIYINKEISFSLGIISKGFVPYEGDWIEVLFSMKPGTSNFNIHRVKPMNLMHVDEVLITSVRGRKGVVDDTIFFTLDCLKRPSGYMPQLYDIVNVVIVDSVQYSYSWRAISMTPVF